MNRDQTINKCIQNFIENDSEKIEKTLKIIIVEAAQKRKPARGPLGTCLPRAQAAAWAWAGILAPTRLPLGLLLARSPPAVPSRPSPPIKIGRPGALFAGSKPDDAVSPQTLGHSPLPFLSPLDGGDGHWPWWPGGAGGAAPPRLARRRARARRRVSAPPSSRPWTEPCSRAPRARPRRPGAATPASRALAATVARGPGRSRALLSLGLGLGFAVRFHSKSFFSFRFSSHLIRERIQLSRSRSTHV